MECTRGHKDTCGRGFMVMFYVSVIFLVFYL
uniref:Uncharacterized protein n=1 Tax=Arundo donax TaxID=35708 RepID=A0A0A9B129_ARUDO